MLYDAFWLDVQVQMPRKLHIGLVIKFIGYLANKLIRKDQTKIKTIFTTMTI